MKFPNNVKSFGNTVVYLGNLSVYEDERECLIKSGSLLKIENITKNNEGIFIVKSKLMSGGYKGFCEYLEQDYKGEILDLSRNNLGNLDIDKITSLSNALMKNKTITTLKLSDNKLWWHDTNAKNVKILAEALRNNKTITTVNMSRNWCDIKKNDNFKIMIEAINNNNRIKSLDLGQNHLGFFDNFKLLCKMLMNNKTITYLNLTYYNLVIRVLWNYYVNL